MLYRHIRAFDLFSFLLVRSCMKQPAWKSLSWRFPKEKNLSTEYCRRRSRSCSCSYRRIFSGRICERAASPSNRNELLWLTAASRLFVRISFTKFYTRISRIKVESRALLTQPFSLSGPTLGMGGVFSIVTARAICRQWLAILPHPFSRRRHVAACDPN